MKTLRKFYRNGLLAILFVLLQPTTQAEVDLEYEIKAAYLYKFVQLTEWPTGSLPPEGQTITLGVFGKNPFGAALTPLNGKMAKGRTIRVKEVSTLAEAKICQIVFIAMSDSAQLSEAMKVLAAANVLTIGETTGFATSGGLINFIEERNKIRFEINQVAARKLGFNISSELLKIARLVKA